MKKYLLQFALVTILLSACKKQSEEIGTCTDGIKNQSETAIDCGGSCAACPGYYIIARLDTTLYRVQTDSVNNQNGNWTVPGNTPDDCQLAIQCRLISNGNLYLLIYKDISCDSVLGSNIEFAHRQLTIGEYSLDTSATRAAIWFYDKNTARSYTTANTGQAGKSVSITSVSEINNKDGITFFTITGHFTANMIDRDNLALPIRDLNGDFKLVIRNF